MDLDLESQMLLGVPNSTAEKPSVPSGTSSHKKPKTPPSGPITRQQSIHESELAAILGITRQAISERARSGVLTRIAPATYRYPDAIQDYVAQLRKVAGNGRPSSPSGDALKKERTRLAREQADATALKNAQLRGELVPVADVRREWESVLRDVRASMLAVPSRFASTQPHLTPHDIAQLGDEIRAALEGLADGND